MRYSFLSVFMKAIKQKELLDERVACRREIQFGHMRQVASGKVDLQEPFSTTPPKLRPKWVRRREGQVKEEDVIGYRPPYAD